MLVGGLAGCGKAGSATGVRTLLVEVKAAAGFDPAQVQTGKLVPVASQRAVLVSGTGMTRAKVVK